MDFISVNSYLDKLHGNELYTALSQENKEKIIFSATELLLDNFKMSRLSDRAIAIQVLFMLEGDDEEFSKYKRQGVKSFSTKGVSVSFEGGMISPEVFKIVRSSTSPLGRLI
ncbi:hypothetical protein [Bacillus suaedae]|uniref:Uncharacterized protein n=1 Tax=Halalkalibacter suaedae TaxID=2822140 RepID=A0A941AMY9_9BACI|nr:hypothetical protein [Bacillus suaedae]MBP3950336.1 hypothetical protein [Bacillus suaedae]